MAVGGTALAADHKVPVDVTDTAGNSGHGNSDRGQIDSGPINHGQFVSNFVRALKLQLNEAGRKGGIGCLVRLVAQSNGGKDDGQGPTGTDGQPLTSADDLVAMLDDASCEPDDDDEASDDEVEASDDADGPGNGKGHAYGHSKGVGNPHSKADR